MINLNKSLYKEISETVKKKPVDYPSIKNFIEKSATKELEKIKEEEKWLKQEEERNKEAKHLFSLFAQGKLDEIKKLYPYKKSKIREPKDIFSIFEDRTPSEIEFLKQLAEKKLEKSISEKIWERIITPGLVGLDYADVNVVLKNAKELKSVTIEAEDKEGMYKKLKEVKLAKKAKGAIIVFEIGHNKPLLDVTESIKALPMKKEAPMVWGARLVENMTNIRATLVFDIGGRNVCRNS